MTTTKLTFVEANQCNGHAQPDLKDLAGRGSFTLPLWTLQRQIIFAIVGSKSRWIAFFSHHHSHKNTKHSYQWWTERLIKKISSHMLTFIILCFTDKRIKEFEGLNKLQFYSVIWNIVRKCISTVCTCFHKTIVVLQLSLQGQGEFSPLSLIHRIRPLIGLTPPDFGKRGKFYFLTFRHHVWNIL